MKKCLVCGKEHNQLVQYGRSFTQACEKHGTVEQQIVYQLERVKKLEAECKRLKKALSKSWHLPDKIPKSDQLIIIRTKSDKYRIVFFKCLKYESIYTYDTFDGITAVITRECVVKWAYLKELEGK